MTLRPDLPPALVLSLDFELHWGVRDRLAADGPYRPNLLGAREVIPRILDLFTEFDISATWATVGFLFARSRAELERFSPDLRPRYADPRLDAYRERIGTGEEDDPLHFAPGLIEHIRRTPRQEIATHTFSHFYCHEAGNAAAALRADLAAARAIASARQIELRSIVFPRNQHSPALEEMLLECGLSAFRGNPDSWMWRFVDARDGARPAKRLARLMNGYTGLPGERVTFGWDEVLQPNGLANVRASVFLRPYTPRLKSVEPLRVRRLRQLLRSAARAGRILHLWWHPHNFGAHQSENLRILRGLLQEFAECRERFGMRSLSMLDVGDLARSARLRPTTRSIQPGLQRAGATGRP